MLVPALEHGGICPFRAKLAATFFPLKPRKS